MRIHKAMIMRSAGNLAEAERELISILDQTPNVEAQRQLAFTYNDMGIATFLSGYPKEAIAWFDAAMRESPDDPNFFINKGDCYRATNDFESALANYNRSAECGAEGEALLQRLAIGHYSIARSNLKNNKISAALFEMNQAIEIYSDFADFFTVRAKIKVALGQYEGALEDLMSAIKKDPKNEEARRLLNIHESEHKSKKAKKNPKFKLPEVQPLSIEDLRSCPFEFIRGNKRLPKKK